MSLKELSNASPQSSRLVNWFRNVPGEFVVALSGGVDSAVVAKAGSLSGATVTVATGESPSLAREELRDALATAEQIRLPHQVIATHETLDANYQLNDSRRCYHCKTHLFETLRAAFPSATIVTGTNADDLQDYRPGLKAAEEHRVRAPLAELGFGKSVVRQLADEWHLVIADKPASPCLASRIAYGLEVTHERLMMVEQAEAWLRERGLVEFRVRLHPGDLARIEVPLSSLMNIASEPTRGELLAQFRLFGFRFVTLDLAGFQSGSLNQLVQLQR